MLSVISPAKSLDFDVTLKGFKATQPLFKAQSQTLANILHAYSAIDIKISNSQFWYIISFIIGIFPKWGLKMGAKKIARMPEKTQLRIAKISWVTPLK